MTWQYEVDSNRLQTLRRMATQVRRRLIDAETELAEKMGELRQIEAIFESRLGSLFDELERVEEELADLYDQIQRRRNHSVFGSDYRSADEQYRRTWQKPIEPTPSTSKKTAVSLSEAEMKKLYRQLARQYHPDLAANEAERAARTQKMMVVNEAYAARSAPELLALAEESEEAVAQFVPDENETLADMVRALESEIARCRLRIQAIQGEIQQFHHNPIVQTSLEMKLARRQGRDLLGEMANDLKRKIAQKTAERDMIKAQFDNLQKK